MDPISTAAGAYSAKEMIRVTVGRTYEYLLKKHDLLQVAKFKDRYIEYCERLLQVKTLASQERSVFIDDIYVPLKIKGINTLSLTVDDGTALDFEGRAIVIKGLAGMGKSTILRKLLANNAKTKERLPIFYELKNYRGGDIEHALSNSLRNAGITINASQVESVLSDSNVKLYLDAFDETPPPYREQLVDEISRIINRYNCHLICTSRPDTELDALVDVEAFNVDTLSQEQIFAIIRKTSSDSDKADSLCEALKRSPLHRASESILKSPILVVLYCVSYNLGEEIPSTLSQFYANIFDTIFYRHDNLKGKVNRIRHWNDNRRIYKSLFEYLCFISQRSGVSSFSKDQLVNFVSDSLAYMNEDPALADKVTVELTSITNLIIEDGYNEYRYIHKSIQEFFASAFVCSLQHDKKYSFYHRCHKDISFHSIFANTLFFLEEIDYYDYAKHYLIPSVSGLLDLEAAELKEDFYPSASLVDQFLDVIMIRAKRIVTRNDKLKSSGIEEELYAPSLMDEAHVSVAQAELFLFAANELLNIDIQESELLKQIVKSGRPLKEGLYQASLKVIFTELQISKQNAEEALLIGVGILYKDKYNRAVSNIKNRAAQVAGQGYLDFD